MPPIIRSLRAQRLQETRDEIALLTHERDNARADARELAHAYTTDNRPRAEVVARALAYPVLP
jgi:hypothetical protein